ncbi:outer membrane beta-barrel domain-containing protein [Bdellovibrio sp. HCB185ZH]|uniref:outer membrane beta-barrel domain-containing protein n=1 Tax=Bdellovibrio sp. HCB185ZH TaxID=3394235 RepID=UPI0039A724B6
MLKNGLKALIIIGAALLLHKTAFAAELVELPVEELAKESVLPIFDKSVSVKNRRVVTAGRIDANVFYGMALTEPIYDVSKFGLSAYYNWNEDHAIGFLFAKNSSGLSSYAKQLYQEYGLDYNYAPKPEMTLMADYNLKVFYGKMSLTKSTVINTQLFGTAALGMVKFENKAYPALALGLGQKFYFTSQLALRFDLRLYMNQAPIPFNAGLKPSSPTKPSKDSFEDRLTYTTNLDVGLSYLF